MGFHREEEQASSEPAGAPLSPAEDSELRQLTWFARAGQLGEAASSRVAQLRARDRRSRVRDDRPDPVSRAGDQVGRRLELVPDLSISCQNCGTPVSPGQPWATMCSRCGFRLPVS